MSSSSIIHVLFISADSGARADLLAYLRAHGYRISLALDGRQGLDRSLALRPDLVLSEYDLPGLRGDAMLRMFRSHPRLSGLPCLFLGDGLDSETRVSLLRSGARDVLAQDCAEAEVLERIRLHLQWDAREIPQSVPAPIPAHVRPHLVQAVSLYIAEHLDAELSGETLAGLFAVSERRLNDEFKQMTGGTVHEYVRDRRMEHACRLLEETNMAVHMIAAECGYASPANFATAFRHHCGVTPSAYRKEGRLGNRLKAGT